MTITGTVIPGETINGYVTGAYLRGRGISSMVLVSSGTHTGEILITYTDNTTEYISSEYNTTLAGYVTSASSSASAAASSATAAATSETNASTSATSASGYATTATTKASEAATSAANASTSASTASTKASEASASATLAATAVEHYPYINTSNKHWMKWDAATSAWVDTDVVAEGEDGVSIVSVTKTGTSGLVDTYTITFSDGTTTTFTVTNGSSIWGNITGTLSNQTDLNTALTGKVSTSDYAPETKTSAMTQAVGKDSDGKLWTTPSSGGTWGSITGTLANQTDLQAALDAKYSKPASGIPSTDMTSAVQTSLGLADTALQSVPSTYRTSAAQDTIDITKANLTDIIDAEEYDSTATYDAGDYCFHNGHVYYALEDIDTPEAFDENKWHQYIIYYEMWHALNDYAPLTTVDTDDQNLAAIHAPAWASNTAYAVGDYVVYDPYSTQGRFETIWKLYRCTTAHTSGSRFGSAYFTQVTVTDITDELKSDLADKVDTSDYAPDTKTSAMTQAVGKDSDGKLWTTPSSGGSSVLVDEDDNDKEYTMEWSISDGCPVLTLTEVE